MPNHFDFFINKTSKPDNKFKWIPADKKLPDKPHNVLVTTNHGFIHLAFYSIEDDEWYSSETWENVDYEIIAWGELPRAYRRGE